MVTSPGNIRGYLALLLHAHLPFVHNLEPYTSLEEKWLFEALTGSYLPLILNWEQLAAEGIDFRLTLSLSPPLISMLIEPALQERYGRYLDNLRELADREIERTRPNPAFAPLAEFYHRRLAAIARAYKETYQGNLLVPLKRLREQGHLELITTAATHGYLPLMLTNTARRAQVRVALDFFSATMGFLPAGMWLPECGYTPGVEKILQAEGVKYFIVASHGMLGAIPSVSTAVYAPVEVGGVAAFGRDWETSHQVWSRTEGYPGDPAYREFYRDIGYDLDYDYLESYLAGGVRGDTGFKYYRITGKTEAKEPYDYLFARERAREHAWDFIANRERQLSHWSGKIPVPPIVVAPYDAELFGHWWFEGPDWLADVLRQAAGRVNLTTPGIYLEQYPPRQEVTMGPSSWGEGGYNRVWLNPANDWVYPHLHRAEKALIQLATANPRPNPLQERALNQAARELLLAQSSDWPFILTAGTTTEYARQRLLEHLENFFRICRDFEQNRLDRDFLAGLENSDNIFPHLDFRLYRQAPGVAGQPVVYNKREPVILMLSWEFPPHHVGGLGIHVRDLSQALARQGVEVHVLTRSPSGERSSTIQEGVYLHYVPTYQQPEQEVDFLSWVLQFNLALADAGREVLAAKPGREWLLHAHDWLVAYGARELQQATGTPLVATIHATEAGRNDGLHNRIQQAINHIEAGLVAGADSLICCSRYMEEEIRRLFQPEAAINVIPNGVRAIPPVATYQEGQTILFVGRLVVEKGVQVLLAALARLQHLYPAARLIIAGDGPYAGELHNLAGNLGLAERVEFTGFVSEEARNRLLARARVAVFPSLYEPFGIVALEAMAAGVPVIVSQTGGLAEVVEDKRTGLTFNPGDAVDLERCLVTIFQNPDLAAELGRNGQTRVYQDYTWEAVARRTLALYRDVRRGHSMTAG
ncbi:1,4-alpha-glucan branching protein domain-containing protein [Moorella naiadis]|uniref:1,4-alpha-glucan branching protein domain-containing protein n=1 Tax=Moorella naiadis (nom. illeg.) TaxID=3093670 RepID=UPI003D9CB126